MKVKEFQKLPIYHSIKEDAIFVADSHYNERRNEFLIFLQKFESGEIKTEQLFLMGDMFDFISGESKYFVKRNQELLDCINRLSKDMEIIYLEGNHDYNMKSLFDNVQVVSRDEQPLVMRYNEQSVALSHGDIFVGDKSYDLYCKIIRNKPLLHFLNFIDINNFISKKIYYTLIKKEICRKISHFEEIVKKRLKWYNEDIVIEGHFHQGDEYIINKQRYKNIPSLTCAQEYVRLENSEFIGVKL